ncbi:MAG: PD40 domain-containing protein [Deltaproteobacteria bacterium]|nr:PD40 domain-containing protein [Deltaproteobacteria bacterium]
MDLYIFDLRSGDLKNLLNSPHSWEEGATITPDGKSIVYMSNTASSFNLDFNNPNWSAQPTERGYWLLKVGSGKPERLTFFNDKAAPEFIGKRVIVAALDISPDGRHLVGTLGVDYGNEKKANVQLKVILIEFAQALDKWND